MHGTLHVALRLNMYDDSPKKMTRRESALRVLSSREGEFARSAFACGFRNGFRRFRLVTDPCLGHPRCNPSRSLTAWRRFEGFSRQVLSQLITYLSFLLLEARVCRRAKDGIFRKSPEYLSRREFLGGKI